jgi:hypothetical protein
MNGNEENAMLRLQGLQRGRNSPERMKNPQAPRFISVLCLYAEAAPARHLHPRGYDSYRSPYQGNIDTAENSPAVPLKGRRSGSDETLSPAAPARKVRCAQACLDCSLKWKLFYEATTTQ